MSCDIHHTGENFNWMNNKKKIDITNDKNDMNLFDGWSTYKPIKNSIFKRIYYSSISSKCA